MPEHWWNHAACLGKPIAWFAPSNRRNKDAKRAARICLGCPVRQACGADAERHGDAYVIRAGKYRTDPRTAREYARNAAKRAAKRDLGEAA